MHSEISQSELLLSRYLSRIRVVLVGTTHSGNIGAVARAMKNMGLSKLHLVSPKEFPTEEAYRRSSGATDILDAVHVHETLDQAISDCHFAAGASARSRSFPWPLFNPRECANRIISELVSGMNEASHQDFSMEFALVFGRESSGLSNDELQMCNYHVNIPANPEYSSLNLAMAVQVLCYELRMTLLESLSCEVAAEHTESIDGPLSRVWDAESATISEVEGMLEHLGSVITETGFYDPKNPSMLVPRLRRLFQRASLDKMEVNILRGILKSVQKRMKG